MTPGQTINEDGSIVVIEALYYRHHSTYLKQFDSIEEARGFLRSGSDYGELAGVGVYVEGEPHSWDDEETLAADQADCMRDEYAYHKGLKRRPPYRPTSPFIDMSGPGVLLAEFPAVSLGPGDTFTTTFDITLS